MRGWNLKKKNYIVVAILVFILVTVVSCKIGIKPFYAFEGKVRCIKGAEACFLGNNFASLSMNSEEKAESYYKIKCILSVINILLSIVIPIFIIRSGLSQKIKEISERLSKLWYFRFIIYSAIFIFCYLIISLPLDFYAGYILKHEYGLSNQNIGRWFNNYFLDMFLNILAVAAVLWIPYVLIKKSPKRWWIYTSLALLPVLFFAFMLQPVYIDPLYNKYEPLKNKEIETKLVDLTRKANIDSCTLLQVDKSKDTKTMNAYMTGIGDTKRIVIWDNTLNKLNTDEIMSVAAHEIGHYKLGHIWKSMIVVFLLAAVTLYIVYVVGEAIVNRFKHKLHICSIGDLAAMPIIILIINITMLITVPVFNSYSRYIELQADIFSLELTRNNEAAISSFEKMTEDSITIKNPGVIYKIWNYDHPTMGERIDFCKNYRPWEKGEKLRYEKYMRD